MRSQGRIRSIAVLVALAAGFSGSYSRSDTAASQPFSPTTPAPRSVVFMGRTMGTYARVVIVTTDSASVAVAAADAFQAFARVDSLMSNWTTTSEVARLNREASNGPTPVQPEVAIVLKASLDLWRDSEGAFDMTVEPLVRLWGFLGGPKRVPSEDEVREAFRHVGSRKLNYDPVARTMKFEEPGVKIDLGGIAKGYGVDVAADRLRAHGIQNALVDLSGNMMAIGRPPTGGAWRIGVRDPRDRVTYFATLPLRPGEAISTSGKYEQFVAANGKTYGHILDPRTGRPAEGLTSVTVITSTAMNADAWDTPLFVLGAEAARRKAKERTDVEAILVEPGADGIDTVWVEASLRPRFHLEPEGERLFRVKYF